MAAEVGVRVLVLGVAEARRDIGSFNQDVRGLESTVRQVSGTATNFGRNITAIGTSIAGLGRSLTVGLTLPIVAAGAGLVNAGIQFEDAFAGIAKTVDGVADSTGKLTALGQEIRQDFRDLALEIPISAVELSKIGEIAGQLGIQGRENLVKFTETIALIGVATNLSTEEAAFGLARLGNIFGRTGDDLIRFAEDAGNAIVFLGNNFAATEQEILAMSLRLAGAGRQAGLTEADVLGISTALAAIGVRAELGGSSVSRVIQDILIAVSEGGEKLDKFAEIAGLSSESFARTFRTDASKAIELFLRGLAEIEEQGGASATALDELGLRGIRIRDVMGRLVGDTGLISEAVAQANANWASSNALQDEATKRFATVASQIQLLKNALTDLGIVIFDDLSPSIVQLIEFLKSVISDLKNLDPTVRSNIIRFAALAAILGPVLVIIGLLIAGVGTAITALLSLVASPILAGIALLVGSLLTLVDIGEILTFVKNIDLLETLKGLGEKVSEIFDRIKLFVTEAVESEFFKGIQRFAESLLETLKDLILFIEDILTLLFDLGDGSDFDDAKENLGPFSDSVLAVRDFIEDVIDKVKELATVIGAIGVLVLNPPTERGIGEQVRTTDREGNVISDTGDPGQAANTVDTFFGEGTAQSITDVVLELQKLNEELVKMTASFAAFQASPVGQFFQGLKEGFLGVNEALLPLREALEDLIVSLGGKEGVAENFTNLGSILREVGQFIGVLVGAIGGAILAFIAIILVVNQVFAAVSKFARDMIVSFINLGAALFLIVIGFGAGLVTLFLGILQAIVGLITNNADLVNQGLANMVKGVALFVAGVLNAILVFFKNFRSELVPDIEETINTILEFFGRWYDELVGRSIVPDLVSEILRWFRTLSDSLVKIFTSLKTVFFDPLSNAFNALGTTISTVVGNAEKAIQRLTTMMSQAKDKITGSPTLAIQHPFELFDDFLKATAFDFNIRSNADSVLNSLTSTVPVSGSTISNTTTNQRSVSIHNPVIQDQGSLLTQINRTLGSLEGAL